MALNNATLNDYFEDKGYICLKDMGAQQPPENISDPLIINAFRKGAVSFAARCWNAAGYFLSYLFRTINARIAPVLEAAFDLTPIPIF